MNEIASELSAILEEQGLGWIEAEVDALIAEDPDRVRAPVEGGHGETASPARLLILLEAIQRTAQTVVACDLDLLDAQARHEQREPWAFIDAYGEFQPIVDAERADPARRAERLQSTHALGKAIAALQRELAEEWGEGAGPLVTRQTAGKMAETRLREKSDVAHLWSDTPELRYEVERSEEDA